ncbi:hypothetical protein SOVF_154940 [Spinacia oleracea]|uniref:Plant UBX domain-containing protein 3 n=1 Tax=Spinacia oleracea TaxID=3562 RepID=A0A9R0HSX8_SPIOL|nr:plant UBX domain-containing protein 3-like [Spinacia oleracea]KNA09258.1 hypothetical protein SOVF_154940 [Spinacia oleracea]
MEPSQEHQAAATISSMASGHRDPNNAMINTFMEITSSTFEEAQFFLESHNFDVDAAVSTFFESTSAPPPPPPSSTSTAAVVGATDEELHSPSSPSASLSPSPSRSRSHSPPAGVRSQYGLRSRGTTGGGDVNDVSSNSRSCRRAGGVRTFADLHRNSAEDGSGSDSDSDRPAEFYTGGQKSGVVVQDPSKENGAEAIFEQARRNGASEVPVDFHQPSSSSRSFTGTARLLSGETMSSSPHEQAPEAIVYTVTLWRNGFTVNDGPLRRFDDEENASFLESITKSECPIELAPADRKTAVRCNLVRRNEKYPEPQKQKVPFQGVGRTLGSSSSNSSELSASVTAINSAPAPVMGLVVDDTLPSTSIQLRLADGTRMVSRFNYHHTVRDIHAFIDASRAVRTGAYTLQMMGFPPRQLNDVDQTIEQAGLANSVVIQKF